MVFGRITLFAAVEDVATVITVITIITVTIVITVITVITVIMLLLLFLLLHNTITVSITLFMPPKRGIARRLYCEGTAVMEVLLRFLYGVTAVMTVPRR